MITSALEMRRALRRGDFAGIILWQGASAFDGAPIAVIVNRITRSSQNGKTGAVIPSFIIRTDVSPLEAIRSGLDSSVCADCLFRPIRKKEGLGGCYVRVEQSVQSVWRAFQRGRYARPGIDYDVHIIPELFRGCDVRLGSYGEPTAAPFQIWRAFTLWTRSHEGYTHQWRDARFALFRTLCMASCDCEKDVLEARAAGWRCFRGRVEGAPLLPREINCGASKEMGHRTSCRDCRACGGTSSKARVDITIVMHGGMARAAARSSAYAELRAA